MSRIVHVSLDVRGALRWSKRQMARMFVKPSTGKYATANEVHEYLCEELAKGHEKLPLAKDCEEFDYKTGCPGHDAPAEARR